jgi:hypothetical protein
MLFTIVQFVFLMLAVGPVETRITAEGGKLVVEEARKFSTVEKLTIEAGNNRPAIEITAKGNRLLAHSDRGTRGWQVEADRLVHRKESQILVFSGKPDRACELKSYFKDGEWKTDQSAKIIRYFLGGAFGIEN